MMRNICMQPFSTSLLTTTAQSLGTVGHARTAQPSTAQHRAEKRRGELRREEGATVAAGPQPVNTGRLISRTLADARAPSAQRMLSVITVAHGLALQNTALLLDQWSRTKTDTGKSCFQKGTKPSRGGF